MGKMKNLSICIVNYKANKELKRCLASISKFTKGMSYEVIVIDNSKDNKWYPGGNNLALVNAKGKYILFLNPDCYLTENSVANMADWMDKYQNVGACEPQQVYDNGEIAPTGSLLPVWWMDGVELTGLSKWFGSVGRRGAVRDFRVFREFRQSDNNRGKNWRTEVVSGAAMMVRKMVLDQMGGFDEKLKLYYTDVDLCRRILNAGFEVWHLGEFSLGHSTRKSTEKMKWNDVYDIYAEDARNYYKKWGEGVGGTVLFLAMKINKVILKITHTLMR